MPQRILALACVLVFAGLVSHSTTAVAQQPFSWYQSLWPYDGGTFPIDVSKAATGATPEEVCAKRLTEMINGHQFGTVHPLLFSGLLPGGRSCGNQWLNTSNGSEVVVNSGFFTPQLVFCGQFNNPLLPIQPMCQLDCPADQKDPATGKCRLSGPKDAGPPCPACANPVHPGTGNKYQEEVDLPPAAGQLSLTRFYNSGRPAYDGALGGYWLHTFSRRIMAGAQPATQATAYRNDGRQFVFTLQGANWVGDADVADVLIELKDASGRRTGWQYRAADTEDTETYSLTGYPTRIVRRSGLEMVLTYTDGSDGSVSGNGGFALDAQGNPTTTVLPIRLLLRVRDHFGRTLSFGYDSQWRIVKVTDPAGGVYRYAYANVGTSHGNLVSVTYPDGTQRAYHYNEQAHTSGTSKLFALTGITDENGKRFATYRYDGFGRAIESLHHSGSGDVNRHQLSYTTSGVATAVTDPRGTVRTYGYQTVVGVVKNNALTQPGPGSLGAALTYDAAGNIASRTDFNGNRTDYAYDLARNLETSRTEAAGTPLARTITTQWHPGFRLPAVVAEPLRSTTNAYDAKGNLLSRTVQPTSDASGALGLAAAPAGSPRVTTYTYNAIGQVLSVDGPRSDAADTTLYTYDAQGNVATVTNALGHATSITAYNPHGQPLTMVDANGLATTMAYDARLRLTSRAVGSEVTTYAYDNAGQLTRVTLPDGSYLDYGYDDAHRLTSISDNLGNRIAYTLDAMGNRVEEQVFDPASALAQKRSREFNALNRLFRELGAQGQATEYAYDDQGNVTSVKDPLNKVTANQYDALNRLRQVTDPGLGVTQYGYNGLDALVSVSDPRSLVTGYAVDGLGNLTQQVSPDTGTTTSTYDAAGNLLTQTDAKGQVTSYVYDALNRVTLIAFHDGTKQQYAYDTGANGIGRLASITERDAADQQVNKTSYAYDQHGRVLAIGTEHAGVTSTVSYSYDGAGRLAGMTYPSGRTLAYAFDSLGRVSGLSTTRPGESALVVVSSVAYHPFGGVKGFTMGNGQSYARAIDLDGRIASYSLGAKTFAIGYDAASRIAFVSDLAVPANSNTYSYDAVDRLTGAVTPGTPYAYTYDAVGNRTSRTAGSSTEAYTYSGASNRIATVGPRSFAFDPNGSTTGDGNNTYAYDARGRMVQATSSLGTTSYKVNALGQRMRKSNSLGDTVYHYDTNGRLIAESDPGGALKRELLYLGDLPVYVWQ